MELLNSIRNEQSYTEINEMNNIQRDSDIQRQQLQQEIQNILTSTSWKVTKPLRFIGEILRKIK